MRDAGVQAAIEAKGLRGLGRALGITHNAILGWGRVPQGRVFEIARLTQLAPEILRPDLADWIAGQRARQRMAAARTRFSLVKAAAPAIARAAPVRASLDHLTIDLLTTLAAAQFVCAERKLGLGLVIAGRQRIHMGARSWSMALGHVAGGASATVVGRFFETSRQNVDNAAERYLRARDGDDPDDFILGEDGLQRVNERGRLRPIKTAATSLWDAELRFRALLEDAPPDERKRA
jgi:hypothetical protein